MMDAIKDYIVEPDADSIDSRFRVPSTSISLVMPVPRLNPSQIFNSFAKHLMKNITSEKEVF